MLRRVPLSLKLGAAFFGMIVLSVAVVYFLTASSVSQRFDEYRREKQAEFTESVRSLCIWYWRQFGSWVGVDQIFYHRVTVRIGEEVFEGVSPNYKGRFSLATADGRIFLTTERDAVGTTLSPSELERSVPIVVDGEVKGTLFPVSVAPDLDPQEATFLASAKKSALIGGGIAATVAFALSILLIAQILSPLRVLTRATESVARGELPTEVSIRSRDELGRLGESFSRMVENLRRSERLRQTMTADIAHEIRTPVTIIQGTLEAILDGVYEPAPETIAPIYEETLHLGRLIDDLRDLALAEAGELRLNREMIDVAQLVRQVVEAAAPSLEGLAAVDVVVEGDSPAALIDPKRFRQVLANLLSNALRHTPAEGKITVTLQHSAAEFELSVVDSGPGIAPADLPHIFERFYRGDPSRSRTVGGSGLGLAIVKQWVEAHGGRIRAENAGSGGAKFTLHMPLG
ncbi:MAG: ATP-binding protein [Candidatus Bipolaricaulota bacterium]